MKITINLKKEELSAGSLNLSIGNLQLLVLHRVLRLLQLYLSPLDLHRTWSLVLPVLHWAVGPSLRVFQSRDKYISVKVKMDGPTLLIPEMKENPHLFSVYLGKVSLENMLQQDGTVENLMLELVGGQVTRVVMNLNQCIEERGVIIGELGCKMDMKRSRGKGTKDAVISVDNLLMNLSSKDIQLGLHILQNNLLKTTQDLSYLLPDFSFELSEEQEPLVCQDSRWSVDLMVDQVKLDNLMDRVNISLEGQAQVQHRRH